MQQATIFLESKEELKHLILQDTEKESNLSNLPFVI
jgi:hypothetical protein